MNTLHDYQTGEYIREATSAETEASVEAAKHDGGCGVILIAADDGAILRADDAGAADARRVYVQD